MTFPIPERRGCNRVISLHPIRRIKSQGGINVNLVLLIVLVLLLVGALPAWPYSAGWGYFPSGILGTVLLVVLIMALLGRA